VRNLGGNNDLAGTALTALVKSAATVSPRGKQASFASRARASFILAERGTQQPRTLAAAFMKPIATRDGDIGDESVAALKSLASNLDSAYGVCADERREMVVTTAKVVGSLDEIVAFARGIVQ
jgi:CRISPR system Cascade subunit CasC